MTLEHGETHGERGLITDRIAHVKEADADLWSKSVVWRGIH